MTQKEVTFALVRDPGQLESVSGRKAGGNGTLSTLVSGGSGLLGEARSPMPGGVLRPSSSSWTQQLTRYLLLACLLSTSAPATELKKETLDAFERYVRLTEARIDGELQPGKPFLWVDGLPEAHRDLAYTQLRQGQVVIERVKTLDNGKDIEVPGGLIHHWKGAVFIPGATLKSTLALVQDYDHHEQIYKPEVIRSKLLRRDGNDFTIFLRFLKKKVIAVVLNTEHDVHYFSVDATRTYSRSMTTRIAEVEDASEPDGPEKPAGQDHGFLWRLNSYWRFQEKDGGVYLECEAVSLTRGIPAVLAWLIRPFVSSIPKESLSNALGSTRAALMKQSSPADGR